MSRWPKGCGSGSSRTPEKKLPKTGRNVEGETYTVVEERGERLLKCRACGALVTVTGWWRHGTAEDPHRQP